jgi:hypothetical protein
MLARVIGGPGGVSCASLLRYGVGEGSASDKFGDRALSEFVRLDTFGFGEGFERWL